MNLECKKHGVVRHAWTVDNRWKCCPCRMEGVARRRLKIRQQLIQGAGGMCIRCGYNSCIAALSFHHRNPKNKLFPLTQACPKSLATQQLEAAKCDLLCMNCHMEEHYMEA